MYVCNAHTKRTNVRSEREKTKTKKVAAQILFYFLYFVIFLVCHFIVWREKRKTLRKRQNVFFTYNTLTVIGFLL